MRVSSLAVLWLLCASTSYAAPGPKRVAAARVCDPHSTTVRKLPRPQRSFGGPLAMPSKHMLAGLTDGSAQIKRGSETDQSNAK